jgi:transcriptional regulator with XRE-family HTH domain
MAAAVPNNLRQLRRQSGMTKNQIAERAQISVNQYSKLENATRPLRLEYMLALSQAFGVSLDQIFSPAKQVRAVGTISGDGRVRRYAVEGGDEQLPFVPTPPEVTEATTALVVKGPAMGSYASNGSIAYFNDVFVSCDDCIGDLCLIRFDADAPAERIGRIFQATMRGRYDVVLPSGSVQRNARVSSCAPIEWIKPTRIRDTTKLLRRKLLLNE